MSEWVLNGEQVKKILETESVKVNESDMLNDIHLTKEERIKHAKKILESWKAK